MAMVFPVLAVLAVQPDHCLEFLRCYDSRNTLIFPLLTTRKNNFVQALSDLWTIAVTPAIIQ
jgi:hypothetical protein